MRLKLSRFFLRFFIGQSNCIDVRWLRMGIKAVPFNSLLFLKLYFSLIDENFYGLFAKDFLSVFHRS